MKKDKPLVYPRITGSWKERDNLAAKSFKAWETLESFITSKLVMSRLGVGLTGELVKLIRAERYAQNEFADYVENHDFPIPLSEYDEDCGRDARCPACASLRCREYDNGTRYECASCRLIYVGDTVFPLDYEPEGACPVCGNEFLSDYVDDCLHCGCIDESCVRCPKCRAVFHKCGYIDKSDI